MNQRVTFGDVELGFEVVGNGEPIVAIHAGAFVSWYQPVVALLSQFSILCYRRDLVSVPGNPFRPLAIEEDAATCRRLLDHVGWPAAHVVGHSYGALVALQLAVDAPDRVRSLALLEPASRAAGAHPATAEAHPVSVADASGDTALAMDLFLRSACGDDYRAVLDAVLPHAFEEAISAADLFFQAERSAVERWSFGPAEARLIAQPVLNVLGTATAPRYAESSDAVQSWIPHAERLTIPDAGHLMTVENPAAVAQGLADFFGRVTGT